MSRVNFHKHLLIFIVLFLSSYTADAAIIVRPVINTDLVGYWSFNEGERLIAYDYSGNGNDGSLTNMDADWVDSRAGRRGVGFDTAVDFDTSDDVIVVEDVLDLIRWSNG